MGAEEAGCTLAPPLRIHSCRVKWSPDTAAATELGTAAMWAEPLKEKTREESEEGRVGRDEVQLAAGDGGGRRSTSPLTAPGDGTGKTQDPWGVEGVSMGVILDSITSSLQSYSVQKGILIRVFPKYPVYNLLHAKACLPNGKTLLMLAAFVFTFKPR